MKMKENSRQFCIKGMNCAGCAARVERAVGSLDGVKSVSVNLLTNSMNVDSDLDDDVIIKAVKNAGYSATRKPDEKYISKQDSSEKRNKVLKIRLILSLAFLALLMYITMLHNMFSFPVGKFLDGNYLALGILQMVLSAAVILVNRNYFTSGFKSVLHKGANMDTLVSLGSGISFLWSVYTLFKMSHFAKIGDINSLVYSYNNMLYFESSAMILAIITIGKLIESISKSKATSALSSLINLSVKKVRVLKGDKEELVDVDKIEVGDLFVLYPGDRIGVDAIVLDGSSAVDESALTGESIYADKKQGSRLLSGSTNISGFLKCRAERVGENTTLNQIIKLVKDASATKPRIAKLADKISLYFVPGIIIISLAVALLHIFTGASIAYAIERAVCTLVISCPCSLGLATPLAVTIGSGKGAKKGILIKNAQALETMAKVRCVVFDKTGTITKGSPEVCQVITNANISEGDFLKIAYAIESKSEHPLAKAVVEYAKRESIELLDLRDFVSMPGEGLEGVIDDKKVYAGSLKYIESKVEIPSEFLSRADGFSSQGKTLLFFANENEFIGFICVQDAVKETSPSAIEHLKSLGIRTIMLTGDNKNCAEYIAKKVNIDEVYSSLLPQEKEAKIRELKKDGAIAMVGDGINDAPSLCASDVGIAIAAGSDIAIDASQVVLINNNLNDVVSLVKLSRATFKNIKENLFWAFFYNFLCIPIAAGAFGVQMSPMLAAAAMSFSSITVCLNALRINKSK